jgi:hypothetical protein
VVRSLICLTVLCAHLKIKVNNCPFVSLWDRVGSFQQATCEGAAITVDSNSSTLLSSRRTLPLRVLTDVLPTKFTKIRDRTRPECVCVVGGCSHILPAVV